MFALLVMIGTNLLVEIFERVFRKSRAKTPLNGQYPGATSVGKKKKEAKKRGKNDYCIAIKINVQTS